MLKRSQFPAFSVEKDVIDLCFSPTSRSFLELLNCWGLGAYGQRKQRWDCCGKEGPRWLLSEDRMRGNPVILCELLEWLVDWLGKTHDRSVGTEAAVGTAHTWRVVYLLGTSSLVVCFFQKVPQRVHLRSVGDGLPVCSWVKCPIWAGDAVLQAGAGWLM